MLGSIYLKKSTTRLNNQMYFKSLMKIDTKVQGYLQAAHQQALGHLNGGPLPLENISIIRPMQELQNVLIHTHDVNINLILDKKVKKK